MSDKDLARRTSAEVFFGGVDITKSIQPYLLSLSYTDNEEDVADDLQISIQDRESVWLEKWLNVAIQAAAASPPAPSSNYKVTAQSGLNVRSGPGTNNARIGSLAYGSQIKVLSITNGWAHIKYSGKDAYVSASYITQISGGSTVGDDTGSWEVGDEVIANGQPQYSSYGEGTPGSAVTNYKASITRLNLKNGVPYPIHVGQIGWFAENQIKKAGAANTVTTSETTIKGLRIQAVFVRENWNGDGKDKVLDCGQFELDSVEASGPPATITIKGTSLPYIAQIRQTKKNKAWESISLSGIAKQMAANNGMSCLYESDYDPLYKRVEQVAMSDIKFLSTLCHDAGISLKVTNNIIVLFDQATYEAKPPVLTIKRGDGTYSKYKLMTSEADTQYASCRVRYTDPATGKTIEGIAYAEDYKADDKDNQQLEVWAKVSSIGEAKTLAYKRLRLQNKYEKSATFTIPGNPDIMAGVTVMLEGWGAWNGKYIVAQSKHTIGGSGYTVQIKLRRVLEGY